MRAPASNTAPDVLTSPNIGIGLLDRPRPAAPAVRRQTVAGINKAQAESLLDWLEARRCTDREVTWEEGKGFTVSFLPPA